MADHPDHHDTLTLHGRVITIAPLSVRVVKRVVFPALRQIDERKPIEMLDGLVQMVVEAAKAGGTPITAEEVEDLVDFVSFQGVLDAILQNSGLQKKTLPPAVTPESTGTL